MTRFGFVIDNRKCIGCHACSTACKAENEVPLGVNRTWVKYVETGLFPAARRHFQVTRCNHCANPPCVHICPTTAMFQRPDGIVEFDPALCIGCKACMQACPYDAIYIDPDTGTAAKCHYCAHRTEVGLEPACVVVCPEHAILAGDLDDPRSEIARAVAAHPTRVRKPEQRTAPKLFYIDAVDATLLPGLARADGLLSATLPPAGREDWRGPIQIGQGRMAGALMGAAEPRETYTVPHRVPWHWPVPAYLVTKAIGAGLFLLGPLGAALGFLPAAPLTTTLASFLALVFIGLTTLLLVADLDRPERFWTILIRPQWRSWLARGAFILVAFSGLAGLYWLGHALGFGRAVAWLAWPGAVFAVLAAVYTAWLFAQAEGRDLWQSSLLAPHLLVQAVLAGAAALLIAAALPAALGADPAALRSVLPLRPLFAASLLVNLILIVVDLARPHRTREASAAARLMWRGRHRAWFWLGALGGNLLPLALLPAPGPWPLILAGLAAIAGLFAYEWAFVMAPQDVPNS